MQYDRSSLRNPAFKLLLIYLNKFYIKWKLKADQNNRCPQLLNQITIYLLNQKEWDLLKTEKLLKKTDYKKELGVSINMLIQQKYLDLIQSQLTLFQNPIDLIKILITPRKM